MAAARVTRLSASVLKVLGHNALSTESSPSPFGPDLMYIIGGKASRILIDAGEGRAEDLRLLLDAMRSYGVEEITDVLVTHYHADYNEGINQLRALLGANVRIWRLPWPRGVVENAAGITASPHAAEEVWARSLARRWSSVKDIPTRGVHKLDKDDEVKTASGDAKLTATLDGTRWMVRVYDGKRMWLVAQFEGNLKLTKSDSDAEPGISGIGPTAGSEVATQTDGAHALVSCSEAAVQTDDATSRRINHEATQTDPPETPRALNARISASSQTESVVAAPTWHQNATTFGGHRITWAAIVYKFVQFALLLLALTLAVLVTERRVVVAAPATFTIATGVLNATYLAINCMLNTFCFRLSVAAESVALACLDGLRQMTKVSFEWVFPNPPPPTTSDYFRWLALVLRCMWQDISSAALQTLANVGGMLDGSMESLQICARLTASVAVDGLLSVSKLLSRTPTKVAHPGSFASVLVPLGALALCALVLRLLSICCTRRQDPVRDDDGVLTATAPATNPGVLPRSPPGSRSASPAQVRDDVNCVDYRSGNDGWYMQLRDGKWFRA